MMSKFENEQEKKVREIIIDIVEKSFYAYLHEHATSVKRDLIEDAMLRIRPYLKVQKKWIGDAL